MIGDRRGSTDPQADRPLGATVSLVDSTCDAAIARADHRTPTLLRAARSARPQRRRSSAGLSAVLRPQPSRRLLAHGLAVGASGARPLACGPSVLDCAAVIDSHTHLFLCDGAGGRAGRRGARGRGGADAHRRHGRRDQRRPRSPPPSATRRSSPRSAATPTRRPGSTTRRRPKSPGSAPTRRCGRSARPGSTTTATRAARDDQRRAFAAQIEIARELELPIVIHARDPEGEQRGGRRDLRHARRRAPAADR